jgi:CRISPR system Cascade subunit CasD
MPQALAFTLWAPLAAMGDVAVGERRGGFDRPARSAILGLVAAALGIDRGDDEGHFDLDRGYRIAQRVRGRGILIEDYHTVQAPMADRKAQWATRREALASPRIETLLSRRDYRADPLVDVALIWTAGAGPEPSRVAEALRHPAYTLGFGRKSCPLGVPPHPVQAEDIGALSDLFDRLDAEAPEPIRNLRASLPINEGPAPVYADRDLVEITPHWPDLVRPGYRILRIERRRDRVVSRRRWQFELREEIVAEPVGNPGERT